MRYLRISSRVVGAMVVVGLGAGVIGARVVAQQRTAAALAASAGEWLASLTPEQRQQATFALDAEERLRWNFIPTAQFPRNGLPLKSMTPPQRERAMAFLKTGLSQRGYMTASAIMDLETTLKAIEAAAAPGGGGMRDPELYFFSVFGTPSVKGGWAARVEGHHVSLHFAVDNGRALVTTAPAFFGSNPADVREGPKTGLRILGAEEDAARALLDTLDATQRGVAIVTATAPTDIVTRTTLKIDPLAPAGLAAAAMTPQQRDLLMRLLDVYVGLMAPDTAADRMAKIKAAGPEKIAFAWAGEIAKGARHYYRVQGPTFLIEYDNTQNNGNHIHSVWRDFTGDFGRDVLREHLALVSHQ